MLKNLPRKIELDSKEYVRLHNRNSELFSKNEINEIYKETNIKVQSNNLIKFIRKEGNKKIYFKLSKYDDEYYQINYTVKSYGLIDAFSKLGLDEGRVEYDTFFMADGFDEVINYIKISSFFK